MPAVGLLHFFSWQREAHLGRAVPRVLEGAEGCSETFIPTLNYTQVSVAAVLAATALLLGRHLQPEAVAEQELPVRWH